MRGSMPPFAQIRLHGEVLSYNTAANSTKHSPWSAKSGCVRNSRNEFLHAHLYALVPMMLPQLETFLEFLLWN